jgi:amino acid transporter
VFVPFSRIVTLAMAAVLCFALLVPMALARHNAALAIVIGVVFVAYLVANVVLWQRMRPRS